MKRQWVENGIAVVIACSVAIAVLAYGRHIERDACVDRNLTSIDRMRIESRADELCETYYSKCARSPHMIEWVARRQICAEKGLR